METRDALWLRLSELNGFKGLEVSHETMVPPLMRVSSNSLQYEEGFVGAISEKTLPGPLCLSDGVNASYLTRIPSSKVYEATIESSLQYVPMLSVKTGMEIWLKREDLQPSDTSYKSCVSSGVSSTCLLFHPQELCPLLLNGEKKETFSLVCGEIRFPKLVHPMSPCRLNYLESCRSVSLKLGHCKSTTI